MNDCEDESKTPCMNQDKLAAEILDGVYDELRRLAAAKLNNEMPGQTLQATALVHEAWVRLSKSHKQDWRDERHFVAAAVESMRRILIDRARKRNRKRHGGDRQRVELSSIDLACNSNDTELLLVDESLERLMVAYPSAGELVKLRYYMGMGVEEAACTLGISKSTAKRRWLFAKSWLFQDLSSA